MKTVTIRNDTDWKRFQNNFKKGFYNTFKDSRSLMISLGMMIDRDTIQTFQKSGSWQGRKPWPDLKKSTKQTRLGTWNIRYGTDKNPKRTMAQLMQYKTDNNLWYKPGPMKGYKSDRRYGANSKPLLASGSFMKSFRMIKVGQERMIYGTQHKLAEKIMSSPTRQALQYTRNDRKRYGTLVYNWVNRKLKF